MPSSEDVFSEVNSLCRENKMNADGSEVTIELFLGGDTKMIAHAKYMYIRHSVGFGNFFFSVLAQHNLFALSISFPFDLLHKKY